MRHFLCLTTLCLLAWTCATAEEEEECRRLPLASYYLELGCKPVNENGATCPTSYDCSDHEKRDTDRCYFRGKAYAKGEEIADLEADTCAAACKCLAPGDEDKPAFNCAQVECPENFGPRLPEDCYHMYEPKTCCSSRNSCDAGATASAVTCNHGNQTYHAGQKFYPAEEPCKVCICSAGFQGELKEPFCTDVHCNAQLHSPARINEGCVPVYFGRDGCCPIEWKCPQKGDEILKTRTKIRTRSTATCRFGNLTLQPGDMLTPTEPNVDCSCVLPPYLSCGSYPPS